MIELTVMAHGLKYSVRQIVSHEAIYWSACDRRHLGGPRVAHRSWRVTRNESYVFSFRRKCDAIRYCRRHALKIWRQHFAK